MSLSARRAWIEISTVIVIFRKRDVALRKESVDRNCYLDNIEITQAVALRKESVDRNLVGCIDRTIDIMSLSARRAWIEMWLDAEY